MLLEKLKKRTTFKGVNDFARKNIDVAFKRRMLATKNSQISLQLKKICIRLIMNTL